MKKPKVSAKGNEKTNKKLHNKIMKNKVTPQRETHRSSMSTIKKTADKWIEKAGMTQKLSKKDR